MPRSRSAPRILAFALLLLLPLQACATPGPPPPRPAPPVTVADVGEQGFGDGTWIVGTDIQRGHYRSAGALPGQPRYCAWSTRSGMAANSRIIDFGTAGVGQAMVVEINAAVKAFTSADCLPWLKVR